MTAATAESPSPSRKLWVERHPALTATAGALLVGVISAGSALLGATVSSSTAQNIAQEQLQSAAEQKAREQREVTYREYLDAANGYRIAAADLFAKTAPEDVETAITSFMTTRARFQRQANEVYVYGSDEAWKAHETVAKTLPPALSDSPLNFNVSEVSDQATFTAAYTGFLAVRCQEVAAKARSGCAG
jgi:hypothetical protein